MCLNKGKIEAISFGKSRLNYFYDDNLIVCLETTQEVKEGSAKDIARNIHF
jgi:hypothetical protein